jgi:hypothetical protein
LKGGDNLSIVKHKDKRSGVVYVYESESFWDKEKKQPRSKRKLIGKIDEETGEIIPTGKSGRKKSTDEIPILAQDEVLPITAQVMLIAEKEQEIKKLKAENKALLREKQEIVLALESLCQKLMG